MRDIDKMLKCRAIFLQSMAQLSRGRLIIDEDFGELLEAFFDSYIGEYFDKFNLIYCFKKEKGQILIREEEEWTSVVIKYLNYFRINDVKNIIKLYDDVGYDNIKKISELAELFYNYIMMLNEDKVMIKS